MDQCTAHHSISTPSCQHTIFISTCLRYARKACFAFFESAQCRFADSDDRGFTSSRHTRRKDYVNPNLLQLASWLQSCFLLTDLILMVLTMKIHRPKDCRLLTRTKMVGSEPSYPIGRLHEGTRLSATIRNPATLPQSIPVSFIHHYA
jgi:hypothetical protein